MPVSREKFTCSERTREGFWVMVNRPDASEYLSMTSAHWIGCKAGTGFQPARVRVTTSSQDDRVVRCDVRARSRRPRAGVADPPKIPPEDRHRAAPADGPR